LSAGRATRARVLLVEPDPELASALTASLTANAGVVKIAHTLEDARHVLHGPERPELIILDLHQLSEPGFAVLLDIKRSSELRQIPTIVFAASDDFPAVERAWDLGANCVIRKPESSDELHGIFPRLSRFWLAAAVLPRSLRSWAARG
jgi:DNA-binding response OmpR family regulator